MRILVLASVSSCLLASCGSPPTPTSGLEASERYVSRGDEDARPAAIIDGEPVAWGELRPLMAEAVGSVILEELALTSALKQELVRRGISITREDVARERKALLDQMDSSGLSNPQAQATALNRVLASRGLGDRRLEGLLARNAMLRAIASPTVSVSQAEIAEAFIVVHGEKRRIRLIVSRDEQALQDAMVRVAGEFDVEQAFAREATRLSTDPSAERGGLIEAFSLEDSRYPDSIRSATARLEVGEVSPVISLSPSFGLIYLVERVPPRQISMQEASAEMEALVRRRKERIAMEELASSLLARVRVEPVDPQLRWSWETRGDAER